MTAHSKSGEPVDDKSGSSGTSTELDQGDNGGKEDTLECPVCLLPCIYPVQLPCGHIFCFLCAKGFANQTKCCAMCRQKIPLNFFDKPNLVLRGDLEQPVTFDEGYGWFYEGVNGWWQYDDCTARELESHHKLGHSSCELLIAGYMYVINLTTMVQSRKNDNTKKRRIKRDLIHLTTRKGIAGLKILLKPMLPSYNRPVTEGQEASSKQTRSGCPAIPVQPAHQPISYSSFPLSTPSNNASHNQSTQSQRSLVQDVSSSITPSLSRNRQQHGAHDRTSNQAVPHDGGNNGVLKCMVCLRSCVYPVQLPCHHIFCYLCMKVFATRCKCCAICRQQIPPGFVNKPVLVCRADLEQPVTFGGYSWFYKGRNGWWQYDDRSSRELEACHQARESFCELLIAGYVYIIDLVTMVQSRRNDHTKKRRVKRDLLSLTTRKGIAGIKISMRAVTPDYDRPETLGEDEEISSRHRSSLLQSVPVQHIDQPTDSRTSRNISETGNDLSAHLGRLSLVNRPLLSVSLQTGSNSPRQVYD